MAAAAGCFSESDINVAGDSTFSGTLSLNEKLEPVFSKGKPVKAETKGEKDEWQYVGSAGTQGTGIFAADYMTKSFEAGGLNINLKYFAKHDKSIKEMDAVNVIQAAIDYFTEVYGPLVYDKNLTILELPAYASGGFAGGNMSAMDETSYDEEGYLPVEAISPDQGGGWMFLSMRLRTSGGDSPRCRYRMVPRAGLRRASPATALIAL